VRPQPGRGGLVDACLFLEATERNAEPHRYGVTLITLSFRHRFTWGQQLSRAA